MATTRRMSTVIALGIALAILGAVGWRGVAVSEPASARGVPVVRGVPVSDEGAVPAGRDLLQRLATLSQFDTLEATASDSVRSATAACLSAYLLLGGEFAPVARAFDIAARLTEGNLQLLQDALYVKANRDGEPGIRASATALYDSSDVLSDWSRRGDDELHRVLEPLGLSGERLYGPTLATAKQKGERLMSLLTEDSTRVFLVGLLREPEACTLHALSSDGGENHFVLVVWRENGFQVLDSGRRPGSRTLSRWSDETATAMLFDTHNAVYWLSRR